VVKGESLCIRKAKARKRAVHERATKLERALKALEKIRTAKKSKEEKKEARASMTDPDARIMKESNGGFGPNYNVQVSTDAAHGVIIATEATQSCTDYTELLPIVGRIKVNLNQSPKQLVVDGGFISRSNIMAFSESETNLLGPLPEDQGQSNALLKKRGVDVEKFSPKAFRLNRKRNILICPKGKILSYSGKENQPGKVVYDYQAQERDCKKCPVKERCCPGAISRNVSRYVDDPKIIVFRQKMETPESKEIYKKRGVIAEFSNLWIKVKNSLRHFSVRSLEKVNAEVLLTTMTYNVQTWIRYRWRPVVS
jgi:hypothetical protein